MVSSLWKACSDGDVQSVHELLKEAAMGDVEIKDHTGATPLTEAFKKGHIEIVRALLNKGANPSNAFPEGRSELVTSDPAMLELLKSTQPATVNGPILSQEKGDIPVASIIQEKRIEYGPGSSIVYPYYATGPIPIPPSSDGATYYSPTASQNGGERSAANGINNGNLPPPEVARLIPCRYFPACRYGAACLFAHPPEAPYYQGSVPSQPQYAPPYEPIGVPPYPPYYAPPSFPPQANHTSHIASLPSPIAPHPNHARSSSEAVLPVPQTPFSPNGINTTLPYGHITPPAYPHPAHPPGPLSGPPHPHLLSQTALPTQSPSDMYSTTPSSIPPFVQHDGNVHYPFPPTNHADVGHRVVNGDMKNSPDQQPDPASLNHHNAHREGYNNHRRHKMHRRGSFPIRKPPCLFFPSGRCKNGDDCRFPHVLSDGPGTHHQSYVPGRNGRGRHLNGNGTAIITERLAGMAIRGDSHQQGNPGHSPTDSVRPRHLNGRNHHTPNGVGHQKKSYPTKQRVPNADDFPVLGGSVTLPQRNGTHPNGNGPTAAQILQAPPRQRDSSKESSPRGTTPDSGTSTDSKAESSGVVSGTSTHEQSIAKLPVSFAAAAASELPKEITLSA